MRKRCPPAPEIRRNQAQPCNHPASHHQIRLRAPDRGRPGPRTPKKPKAEQASVNKPGLQSFNIVLFGGEAQMFWCRNRFCRLCPLRRAPHGRELIITNGGAGPSTSFKLAEFAQMLRRIQVQLLVENNRLQVSVSCKQWRTKESATRGSSCISMTILNSQFRPEQLRGCSLTNRKSAFNKAGAAL